MLLDNPKRRGRLGLRGTALLAVLAAVVPLSAWAAAAALPSRAAVAVVDARADTTAGPATVETVIELSAPQRLALGVGSHAPEVLLDDGPGRDTRLSDLEGQVVVLHFWADWCRFCNDGMPALRALKNEHGDELALAGVSVDESQEAFESFIEEHGLDWPQHRADEGWRGATPQAFGVRALPMHVVLDREGRIAASGVQLAQVRPTIDALLAGRPESGAR